MFANSGRHVALRSELPGRRADRPPQQRFAHTADIYLRSLYSNRRTASRAVRREARALWGLAGSRASAAV